MDLRRLHEASGWAALIFLTFSRPAAQAGPLTLTPSQALSFGKFSAGSGGTITIAPGGGRTPSGGVVLLSTGPGSPARFTVTGDADSIYSVSLPSDDTVTMAAGIHSMPVNIFTSLPSGTGILSGGTQILSVGATLVVDPNQTPADYNGTFSITVDYQ